jgi:hypothetical protein
MAGFAYSITAKPMAAYAQSQTHQLQHHNDAEYASSASNYISPETRATFLLAAWLVQ